MRELMVTATEGCAETVTPLFLGRAVLPQDSL